MYRQDYFGIFHGSISTKISSNRFVINTRTAIFDEINDESLIELMYKHDYRWNDASIDADIHLNIYKHIPEAKYICHVMPPYTTAMTLEHDIIVPKDYFGATQFPKLNVYDPESFDKWYERAEYEVYQYLKKQKLEVMVIRGYGIFAYDRDIEGLSKKIAIIENSCKLLTLSQQQQGIVFDAKPDTTCNVYF